jgi:hypothetical protein
MLISQIVMPFNSDGTEKELGIMLLEFETQTENKYLITSRG